MNAFFYVAISHIPLGTAVTIEFIGPLVLSAVLSHSIRDVLWVGLAMVGVGLFGVEQALKRPEIRDDFMAYLVQRIGPLLRQKMEEDAE